MIRISNDTARDLLKLLLAHARGIAVAGPMMGNFAAEVNRNAGRALDSGNGLIAQGEWLPGAREVVNATRYADFGLVNLT
jgi:hypothetical protein